LLVKGLLIFRLEPVRFLDLFVFFCRVLMRKVRD